MPLGPDFLQQSLDTLKAKPKLDSASTKALKQLLLKQMIAVKQNSLSLQDSVKQINQRYFGNQNASFPQKQ